MRCSCTEKNKQKHPKLGSDKKHLMSVEGNDTERLISASSRVKFPAVCLIISLPKTQQCELETEVQNVVAQSSAVRVPGHTGCCLPLNVVVIPSLLHLLYCCRCNSLLPSAADDLPYNSALVNGGICYF